jgi:hypothetical protein
LNESRGRNANFDDPLAYATKDVSLAKALVADPRERRMIRDRVLDSGLAKPGQSGLDLTQHFIPIGIGDMRILFTCAETGRKIVMLLCEARITMVECPASNNCSSRNGPPTMDIFPAALAMKVRRPE